MARVRTETLRIPEVRKKFVEKTKETKDEIESNGWEKAAAKTDRKPLPTTPAAANRSVPPALHCSRRKFSAAYSSAALLQMYWLLSQ